MPVRYDYIVIKNSFKCIVLVAKYQLVKLRDSRLYAVTAEVWSRFHEVLLQNC